MKSFCRPLDNDRLVEDFVLNILEISDDRQCNNAINLIVNAELQLKGLGNKSTLNHDSFRDRKYLTDEKRKELRKRIFEELISNERLENDDDIILGRGGALPTGKQVTKNKQAYIIIGLPASGKSTIANIIADKYCCMILDSDYAKRKLPEYTKPAGASLVHDESDEIVFGEQNTIDFNLLEFCCACGNNIVIPKIGHKQNRILDLARTLVDWEYSIHLILISLDRQKATKNAYRRFKKTKRYVPLSLIFDEYSNEPILTYYRIKENELFTSYGAISTDGEPKYIESSDGNPAILFKK